MPVPKGRGKVKKVRNKAIPGHPDKYLVCDVMEKAGPRGGKTACHVKTKKGAKKSKTKQEKEGW